MNGTAHRARLHHAAWPALLALALLLVAGGGVQAEEESGPLWLVVTRPAFVEALEPLAAHRRGQGLAVEISTQPAAEALAGRDPAPAFLLLVGDDAPGADGAAWHVPSPRRSLYRWTPRQQTDFPSDALIGDVDDDLLPDIPVGRIPARTAAEVATVVAKIVAYEQKTPTTADLRVLAWAGAPGYGKLLDSMATSFLVQTVRSRSPDWAGRFLLSAAPDHPLAGWLPDQPEIFNRELARGAILGAVVAHASATSVAVCHGGDHPVRYGTEQFGAAFADGEPKSPLVLLACDCGSFDREQRCLAETLLFLPGGPVATVAATTESHPLTNYFTGRTLLQALGQGKRRLGGVWVEAQRAGREARSLLIEKALAGAEGSLEDEIDLDQLRRDQPLLYAIIGDPATRLRIPDPLDATVERTESGWRWSVEKPAGATALQVAVRRPEGATKRVAGKPKDREEAVARLLAANAATAFVAGSPAEGSWTGEVQGPEGGWLRLVATGPGVFRVFTRKLEAR